MISHSPLDAMLDRMVTLSRSVDSALNPVEANAGNSRTSYWVPPLDAWETEHAFVVTLDLPGIDHDAVDISFERNTLTVTGDRRPAAKTPENGELRVFFAERTFGHFSRALRFPQYVEGDKISAHFDRGVLTISVPKAEAAKSRKIAIGTTAEVKA